jgi:hypothetical protein
MSSVVRVAAFCRGWAARGNSSTPPSPLAAFVASSRSFSSQKPAASHPAGAASRTLAELSDAQLLGLLGAGTLSPHRLEADLADVTRAVSTAQRPR